MHTSMYISVCNNPDCSDVDLDQMYETDHELIKQINAAQSLWTATPYSEYDEMTLQQMRMRNGWELAEPV